MKRKEKICLNCKVIHCYSTKLCQNCNVRFRKYGSFEPDHWFKNCLLCGNKFKNKTCNAKYCIDCRKKYNVQSCKNKSKKNPNPKYKRKNGTGTLTKAGYVVITKVGHANAGLNGKIQEHTFIMSQFLGRPLKKGESVHHKNGIRNDNRIENLELWTTQQPTGQRVSDKIKWCKEFLKEYGEI